MEGPPGRVAWVARASGAWTLPPLSWSEPEMRRDSCPNAAIEYEVPVIEQGKAQLIGPEEGGNA